MTEHIEVPVRSDIPLSKYLARLPKALFLKARSHCDRKGVSLNTLITLALRDYLDAGDIDVPSQPKLSQVFKDELAATEARLLAALDPMGLRHVHSLKLELDGTEAQAMLHELQQAIDEQNVWTSSIGTRRRPTRDAVDFVPPSNLDWDSPSPHNHLFPDSPPVKGATDAGLTRVDLGTPENLRDVAKSLGLTYEQLGADLARNPEHWKTAPAGHGPHDIGVLDWDSPTPHNHLFPDSPPVKGAAPEPLRGQVWVVTGDFDTMTTSRVREILQQAGAIVATTVNKKTSAVLAGIAGEGEKLDAAEGRLIPIWTELQFLHMARFIGADVRIPE